MLWGPSRSPEALKIHIVGTISAISSHLHPRFFTLTLTLTLTRLTTMKASLKKLLTSSKILTEPMSSRRGGSSGGDKMPKRVESVERAIRRHMSDHGVEDTASISLEKSFIINGDARIDAYVWLKILTITHYRSQYLTTK
jgi:hypothetical protein